MKKYMYMWMFFGLGLTVQGHGMFRRTGARIVPPVANASEHGVAHVVAPNVSATTVGRVAQVTGAAQNGVTSKFLGAHAAAIAKKESLKKVFVASRARMEAALRGAKIPMAAVGIGAAGEAVGVMMYDDPDTMRRAEGQMFALQQMFPVVGDARQESMWRSMFDAAYAQWLNSLDRKILEQEYKDVFTRNLELEDMIFRRERLRKFQQQRTKKFWESASSYDNRTRTLLDEEVGAMKDHEQRQADARTELDAVWYTRGSDLIGKLRGMKPDLLLKIHADQEAERLHQQIFSGARQKLVDIIKP